MEPTTATCRGFRRPIVGRSGGAVMFVVNIETDGAKIATIRSVLSPQKLLLRHVS